MSTASPEACLDVLRDWNRCHGAFYQASETDLRWNLGEQKMLAYAKESLAGVPAIVGSCAREGAAAGILEKGIWVGLYGEVPAGKEAGFAAAVEEHARSRGGKRVAIGSDEFHFLPGIPVDDEKGKRLAEAFRARGFSHKDCVDYVGDPRGKACTAYVSGVREDAARRSFTLKHCETERDREALDVFMRSEFPGRWTREWEFQRARTDTGRAFWNILRDDKAKVIGFSRLALRGRVKGPGGWTPGAMRLSPSPAGGFRDTDSCLGPIGISKAERGRGAGKVLLGLSIHELSLQGAELLCIDWTDAYNYYTPLEFTAARRWQCVWKEL
jgi:hypothetical protein